MDNPLWSAQNQRKEKKMMMKRTVASEPERKGEEGKIGWILLVLLGVPLPVLVVLFLIRGCT